MIKITSVPVDHYFESQGCAVDVDGGYRIAYSGDRSVRDKFPDFVPIPGCGVRTEHHVPEFHHRWKE